MDQQLIVSPNKSAKPSKSLVLVAVIIAILLSYFLANIWFHKQKANYANKPLTLPKLDEHKTETSEVDNDNGWKIITTQKGDSLASIFKRVGLSGQVLQAVLQNNKHAKTLASIKLNQQIQFLIRDQILEKLIIPVSTTQFLVVYHEGKSYLCKLKSRKMDMHNDYLTATVHGSLYSTAKRMNIPYKLVQQMTEL